MSEDAYARREGFPTKVMMGILAGIVVALWFIFGYGYQTSAPQTGADEPPTLWLVYKGEIYTGVRGTYCWAGECVDTALPDPPGVVGVAKGSSISFMTNSLIEPSSLDMGAFVIDEQGSTLQVGELESYGSDNYRVNLESGVYVVNIFASWEGLGHVGYAFKISVS